MLKKIPLKACLYLLLLAYIFFIVISMNRFKGWMDMILNNQVRITQETREMKTRVLEMQNTLPGLLSNPDMSNNAKLGILVHQEELQDQSFEKIKKLFHGNQNLLVDQEREFANIRKLRREAVEALTGNSDFERAMDYYKIRIAPSALRLYNSINAIFISVNRQMEVARQNVDEDARINILLTSVFGILLGIAFFYADRKDKARVMELASRERLFSQLSRNVNEVFIIASGSDCYEYVTSNSNRVIGLPAAEMQRNPSFFYSFLPSADAQWLAEGLNEGRGARSVEERVVTLDDGDRIFRLGVYPIVEGGVDTGRTLVVLRDDTDAYRQQKALHDALERANSASEAKSNFLSHMSHEIRTPMNAIIGMTTIALSKMGDMARVKDCLGKIAESSRHLLGLINDVLDMSKIENGKLAINNETFNLRRVVQNINNLVRPQTLDRGLDFEILLEKVDEENLVGDALRLNQVLLNIISNAIKFTAAGGSVVIKIQQAGKAQSSVRMRFIISDTGIGMSEEFLKRIYQPFEQASSNTTARYGGTGLGMSITFNLVKLMGGTISVSSKEGVGTTFTVELPFGLGADTKTSAGSLPPLKVLVVDDDLGTCEHAELLLEKMGLKVTYALSGEKAVELVQTAHDSGDDFDVCLIDWKMPGMDGEETARRIREHIGEDMLIIIISSYDWSPIEEKARAAGVNEFIVKPFFASTLYDALVPLAERMNGGIRSEKRERDEKYDFTGRRILLVEDNEFNREIAEEFLSMVNASVEQAVNGEEAVEKFMSSSAGYYDLVLMDVQMPVMDGYEATRRIRASDHPDAGRLHILAMTANAFSEDVSNAVAAGMNGHIAKPIDVKVLYRMIATHLQDA